MTSYKMTAQVEVQFQPPGMGLPDDEYEVAYPKIEIAYRYSPGRPAFTPRGEYGPIDPPEPAEVEFIGAELIDSDGLLPTREQLDTWGSDYLDSDAGYQEAVSTAEDMRRPDPDYAYESRRDDARG